jgi:phosphoribosylaminoimidazole-succinocarboxamide synthase
MMLDTGVAPTKKVAMTEKSFAVQRLVQPIKRARTEGEADEMRAKIREFLGFTLPECPVPELGEGKTGKVRDIYLSGENVVMVTNDRVSAFDFILPNLIPFKGQLLNGISEFTMGKTSDILPNALVKQVDPNVVVQKKMTNLGVEWIVRGFLWGSMAAAYEKGDRTFCGLSVPDGLLRFQKFDTPLFTPTTKAEVGHDENMTMEDIEQSCGKEIAHQAKAAALRLFARGQEVMRQRGLLLLDTKYEFGLDESGKLHVIDEVNTPDSSRMCDVSEWEEKYPKIELEMATGKYKTVSDVLKAKPELKMKEFSKQYVRDALLDMGFDAATAKSAPKLTEEQAVECSYRYISIFERITGKTFQFPEKIDPSRRVIANLQRAGMAEGCFAAVLCGQGAEAQAEAMRQALKRLSVPSRFHVCASSAGPELEELAERYN